jgi:hypothetical protein
VVAGPDGPLERPTSTRAYRPRPRELPLPTGEAFERIGQLTDAGASAGRAEVVALEPEVAARRIVDALRTWGYLGDGPSDVAS